LEHKKRGGVSYYWSLVESTISYQLSQHPHRFFQLKDHGILHCCQLAYNPTQTPLEQVVDEPTETMPCFCTICHCVFWEKNTRVERAFVSFLVLFLAETIYLFLQRECVYTVVNEPKETMGCLHVLFFTVVCGRKNYACAEKMCASFRLVFGKEKTHGERENLYLGEEGRRTTTTTRQEENSTTESSSLIRSFRYFN
jgi:hypothetical protein